MKRTTVIAIAGSIVTCPHCYARIGELATPLQQGWQFSADQIRFAKDQRSPSGQAICQSCLTRYAKLDTRVVNGKEIREMLIHTDFGWRPRSPQSVPRRRARDSAARCGVQ